MITIWSVLGADYFIFLALEIFVVVSGCCLFFEKENVVCVGRGPGKFGESERI